MHGYTLNTGCFNALHSMSVLCCQHWYLTCCTSVAGQQGAHGAGQGLSRQASLSHNTDNASAEHYSNTA